MKLAYALIGVTLLFPKLLMELDSLNGAFDTLAASSFVLETVNALDPNTGYPLLVNGLGFQNALAIRSTLLVNEMQLS